MRSEASGEGDPVAQPTTVTAGALSGNHVAEPFTRRSKRWGPEVRRTERDRLVVVARNIRSVTIDRRRGA